MKCLLGLGVGIIRRILGKRSKDKLRPSMPVSDAVTIIQDYGRIMLNKSPAPFYISDVNKLPYPKDTIKQALMMALSANGKEQTMDVLKIGYMLLANWQQGVGEVDLSIGAVDRDEGVKQQIKRIISNYEEVDEWCALIEEERVMLKSDLVSIGVW